MNCTAHSPRLSEVFVAFFQRPTGNASKTPRLRGLFGRPRRGEPRKGLGNSDGLVGNTPKLFALTGEEKKNKSKATRSIHGNSQALIAKVNMSQCPTLRRFFVEF